MSQDSDKVRFTIGAAGNPRPGPSPKPAALPRTRRGINRPDITQSLPPLEIEEDEIERVSKLEREKQERYVVRQQQLLRSYAKQKFSQLAAQGFHLANVRTCNIPPQKSIMKFRMKRIVSPFEFYLELVMDDDCCWSYDKLFQKIQRCYQSNPKKWQLFRNQVIVGRCYICLDYKDKKWHRVRVLKIHDNDEDECRTATVVYLDLGKMQIVEFENLREMNPDFSTVAAQLLRSYLYEILPRSESDLLKWRNKAIQHFKNIVEGKELQGIIMARSDSIVQEKLPDVFSDLGVVLIDKNSVSGCTINAQMVDAGFAQATGICGGCKHSVFLEEWNDGDLVDKLQGLFVTPQPPPSPPQTHRQPRGHPLNQDEIRALLGTTHLATPPKRSWLRFAHLPESEKDITDQEYRNSRYSPDILPKEIAKRVAQVTVRYVTSPSTIFVHLTSETESFNKMSDALARCYNLKREEDYLKEIAEGMFIACQVMHHDNKLANVWCRAVVKFVAEVSKIIHKRKLSCLLIDYGSEVETRLDYCRALPDCFQNIPSFLHRVHLNIRGVSPPPETLGRWGEDAGHAFQQYVHSWKNRDPIYYIYRPDHVRKPIQLTDVEQEVVFMNEKWVAEHSPVNKEFNEPINALKDHPMLKKFYRSVGVDMLYEVIIRELPFWFFEQVIDNTINTGNAIQTGQMKGKDRVHLDIISSRLPTPIEREGFDDGALEMRLLINNEKQLTEGASSLLSLDDDDDDYYDASSSDKGAADPKV